MEKSACILVTGAAGFIGSCMASYLNRSGYNNLVLSDDFSRRDKIKNFDHLVYTVKIERDELEKYLQGNTNIQYVIHLGARTDTTEMDYAVHEKLNLEFSKMIWNYCSRQQVALVYASSAATYGNGDFGYNDDHDIIKKLQPLNPYGVSKNEFDKWVLLQVASPLPCPPHWYGLKFFNVYGPNEYHKKRMASVVYHAYEQIRTTGKIILFRSHDPHYKDGEQKRDFIYVKDILEIINFLMDHNAENGIYNAGTGKATTFLTLAHAIFDAMDLQPEVTFIDTPIDIRDNYQYFTEANMEKLKTQWKKFPGFTGVGEGIKDYIVNYLKEGKYY